MDYEKELVVYLDGELDVPVYHTAPSAKPDSFVTVRLSSGAARNAVERNPILICKCWAKARKEAAALASQLTDAIFKSNDELQYVFGVNIVGDYREPSPPAGYEQRVVTIQWILNL